MTMFQTLHRSLGRADSLKIRCEPCGRQVAWTFAEAVARCGSDATPMDIRRRITCRACGAAGRRRMWI